MVGFLIFGSNPQSGDSHKLQFVAVDHLGAQEGVDDVDSDEKSLRVELVLQVDVNQPVKKNHSHVLGDVRLGLEIVEVVGWFAHRTQQKLKDL